MLAHLEPKAVFSYFEEICNIPHGSGHTKQISDYLAAFAKTHTLRYIQDPWNNIIIFKDGTAGYEHAEPVILQGHMDMVCEKEAACAIDFKKDGLSLCLEGDYVSADGTTLGGDDGIALAYGLALLSADDIPHPPLEVVFTTDEETGMDGAVNIDLSMLRGRRLINLDSEEEGTLLCGCAGGLRCDCSFTAAADTDTNMCLTVEIDGLLGGHSGTEIGKGRANANILLGQLLYALSKEASFALLALEGGSKDNAIPRSARAVLSVQAEEAVQCTERIHTIGAALKKAYDGIETGMDIRVSCKKTSGEKAVCPEKSAQLVRFLAAVPNEMQAMCMDVPNLVETSLNLGIMKLTSDGFTASFSLRSMLDEKKTLLAQKLMAIAEGFGASFSAGAAYPGWAYKKESALRKTMASVYAQLYGTTPRVEVLHAGLECGILAQKIDGLDCVSIGPDILDIHTPSERLSISSTARVFAYLCEVLKQCACIDEQIRLTLN